jgi:hypothetical protein
MEMIYTNGSTSADALGTLVEMASTEAVKKAYSQVNMECAFTLGTLEQIRNLVK